MKGWFSVSVSPVVSCVGCLPFCSGVFRRQTRKKQTYKMWCVEHFQTDCQRQTSIPGIIWNRCNGLGPAAMLSTFGAGMGSVFRGFGCKLSTHSHGSTPSSIIVEIYSQRRWIIYLYLILQWKIWTGIDANHSIRYNYENLSLRSNESTAIYGEWWFGQKHVVCKNRRKTSSLRSLKKCVENYMHTLMLVLDMGFVHFLHVKKDSMLKRRRPKTVWVFIFCLRLDIFPSFLRRSPCLDVPWSEKYQHLIPLEEEKIGRGFYVTLYF